MHQSSSPRKHRLRWRLALGAVGLACALLLTTPVSRAIRASQWVSHWSEQLQRCHSLQEIHALPQAERPDRIYTRSFPDGSWLAVRSEHACTDGAGFDATVFYDSTGKLLVDRTHHFCGFEGLSNELHQVSATSLEGFYTALQRHLAESE